mgnify:CR=1 FL=1
MTTPPAARKFARAWGALAAGYLSLGGEDERSLTQLAESSAEHALTLDDDIVKTVNATFKQLHEDGLVYRGNRIVNWCPVDRTALSDDVRISVYLPKNARVQHLN